MANLDIIRGRQVVIPLINRTGADSIPGDVVVIDPANDESFITTTTPASTSIVGVVQEDIVSLGTGRVLIAGYAPLVKVAAAVTRGQYAETSAVAKEAQSSATRHTGSFGVWLKGSALPSAVLWGLADNNIPPPASPITVEEVDGTPTDAAVTKIVFPNGSLGIAAHVATYTPPRKAIEFIIENATGITTGIKGDIEVPFACTIVACRLFADQTGSIVLDIWKDSYVNFPPVVGDSITAAAKPTISAANKSEDTTLTGWTVALAAGDVLRWNVDSVTALTRVLASLTVS